MMRDNSPLPGPASGVGEYQVHLVPESLAGSVLPRKGKPGILAVPESGSAQRALEYGKLALFRMGLDPNIEQRSHAMGLNPMWIRSSIQAMAVHHMLATGTNDVRKLPAPPPTKNEAQNTALDITNWHTERYRSAGDARIVKMATGKLHQLAEEMPADASDSVLALCKILDEYFGEKQAHEQQEQQGESKEGDGSDPDESKSLSEAADKDDFLKEALNWMPSKINGDVDDVPWGKMTIRKPRRNKRFNKALRALRPRPGFLGAFRYPHRVLLPSGDGQGFAMKRRARGATVLIDCSGSMEIDASHVEELLEIAPASTVALYGGADSYQRGELVVVVESGRGTLPLPWPFDGSNVVDGPALEWLADQKGPRIWISDAEVTGVGDAQSYQLLMDVQRITRKARIKRFKNIERFLEVYKRLTVR